MLPSRQALAFAGLLAAFGIAIWLGYRGWTPPQTISGTCAEAYARARNAGDSLVADKIRLNAVRSQGTWTCRDDQLYVEAVRLRDTLARLRTEDQSDRDSIAIAFTHHDTLFMRRMAQADSARATWLDGIVTRRGWPPRSVLGDTAAEAAWLIVQHGPSDFQERMLPILENEAKRGEVSPANVAMLFDRVSLHRGQPQRYGTQFEVKGDAVVPGFVEKPAAVDSLRAFVGLPPMAQYVKQLESMYHLPVEWPPSPPPPLRP